MAAEATALPRALIAGIGRFHVEERVTEFPIGWEETDRDAVWAGRQLARWGVDRGSYVLVTAAVWQGPWVSPVLRAVRLAGATFGMADTFGWDARRTATFASRLPLSMIFGLGAATAEALSDSGQLADLFGGVPAILAHPGAHPVLAGSGLHPGLVAFLGPALAVECPQRAGAHVNAAEWLVQESAGGLCISVVGPRAYRAQRVPLGLPGGVVTGPCECGSMDPRVRLG